MFLIVFAAMEPPPDLKAAIRDAALTLGFDAVGFAQARNSPPTRARISPIFWRTAFTATWAGCKRAR